MNLFHYKMILLVVAVWVFWFTLSEVYAEHETIPVPEAFDECFEFDTVSHSYVTCQVITPKPFNASAYQEGNRVIT